MSSTLSRGLSHPVLHSFLMAVNIVKKKERKKKSEKIDNCTTDLPLICN